MPNKMLQCDKELHDKIKLYCVLSKVKVKDFVNDTLEEKLKDFKFTKIKFKEKP